MSSQTKQAEMILYLLGGGPIALMWGLRQLRQKRLIQNIATSKIRSAAMGLVELNGVAQPRTVAQPAPISKIPCCWWACAVQELRSNGKNSHWATLKTIGSNDLFYLDDTTGRVMVNPINADLHVLTQTIELNSATRTAMSPVLQGWGLDDTHWFGGVRRLRVMEQVIPDGAPVYLMGQLISTAESTQDQRARLMARLRAAKADAQLMAAADLNKDGQVDPNEWDALRKQQEDIFYKEELARQANMPNEHQMLVQAPTEHPYIISTGDEGDLVSAYAWKAPLGLLGGLILTGIGGWWALSAGWNPMLIVGCVAVGCLIGTFLKSFKLSWLKR